jgi:hypothetical protein
LLALRRSTVLCKGFFWAFLLSLAACRVQQSDQKCKFNTYVYL